MLSREDTINALYNVKAIAANILPFINKYADTGSHTSQGPNNGKMDAKIASTVNNNALGTPKTKRPIPVAIPCIIPMIIYP